MMHKLPFSGDCCPRSRVLKFRYQRIVVLAHAFLELWSFLMICACDRLLPHTYFPSILYLPICTILRYIFFKIVICDQRTQIDVFTKHMKHNSCLLTIPNLKASVFTITFVFTKVFYLSFEIFDFITFAFAKVFYIYLLVN